MESKRNPFFKIDDLRTSDLKLTAQNSTSQMSMTPGGIEMLQMFLDGIWIEVSPRCCAMGHSVTLKMNINGLELEFLGVIEDLEGDPTERKQIKIRFRQYPKEIWEKFLAERDLRQTELNQLLQNSRK